MLIATIIFIILCNYISVYFWIRLFKEVFKKDIGITDIISYGAISVLSARSTIRLSSITQILSKAVIEEGSKIGVSEIQKHNIPSDHTISAILSGVAFACIENCVYLFYLDENILQISLMRIACNGVLHALFTGTMGFGISYYLEAKRNAKAIFIGIGFIALGILFHTSYNYLLSESYVAFAMMFVIVGYFGLSYLLFTSDRLYLDQISQF